MQKLERQIARLFVVGFDGTQPDPTVVRLLQNGLGGVILFSRNLPDVDTALDLNRQLMEHAPGPFLLCLDQEGGRVQRLPPRFCSCRPCGILARRATQLCAGQRESSSEQNLPRPAFI